MNRKLYLPMLAALAVVGLGVAAASCGDDDSGGNKTPTVETATTVPSGGTATTAPSGGAATKSPSDNGDKGKTTFNMTMNETDGNVFMLDGKKNPQLEVPPGAEITINLENDGIAIHNMRFGGEDKQYNNADDAVSKPEMVSPKKTAVLTFKAPSKAGKYVYQCDFHPTDMLGEIEVKG